MIRCAVWAVLLLVSVPVPAWATAQTPEKLHVNGRVFSMQSTPLAPLLERREDLEKVFESLSSGCWRGYVGTWHVEGDRLYLASLEREIYDPKLDRGKHSGYVVKEVPLSVLFGRAKAPIEATWYTGTLRVPDGRMLEYVHMGFGSLYERELRLEVVRGRVVSRKMVDNRIEAWGRSDQDRTWVALGSTSHVVPLPKDDGSWIDARAIEGAAFQRATPSGKAFRTRGIVSVESKSGLLTVWIPETPATKTVRIPLRHTAFKHKDDPWVHMEIEAAWRRAAAGLVLDVRWLRRLKPGETIHHPRFPLPDVPEKWKGGKRPPLDPEDCCPLTSREDVTGSLGCEWAVELQGKLVAGDPPMVHGVLVGGAPKLVGKDVVAYGYLEQWILTKRLLALDLEELRPFAKLGPGTFYRLMDPATGKPAVPLDPARDEESDEKRDDGKK